MAKFESNVKIVPYSQERVYNKLSDLNNLQSVRDKLDAMKERVGDRIEDLTFDQDSINIKVQGISIRLRIVEREPLKCIKFEGEKTPVPLTLWIQMLPVAEEQAKLKVTLQADVPIFLKAMMNKPLQEGAEKLADMLAIIPY